MTTSEFVRMNCAGKRMNDLMEAIKRLDRRERWEPKQKGFATLDACLMIAASVVSSTIPSAPESIVLEMAEAAYDAMTARMKAYLAESN
jgi:hypothetical protein